MAEGKMLTGNIRSQKEISLRPCSVLHRSRICPVFLLLPSYRLEILNEIRIQAFFLDFEDVGVWLGFPEDLCPSFRFPERTPWLTSAT